MIRAVFIAVLLAVAPAKAGPDATVKTLMDTPASLFDVGMLRLQTQLDFLHSRQGDRFPSFRKLVPVVNYDWGNNKIVIDGIDSPLAQMDASAAENLCRQFFIDVRQIAAVDPNTGAVSKGLKTSFFTHYFGHNGYSNTRTETALNSLDSVFLIRCGAGGHQFSAPLLGNTYSVER